MSPVKKSEIDKKHLDLLDSLSIMEGKLNLLEYQCGEIINLLRILAQPVLSSSLQDVFKTPKQLYIYELSNGKRSTRDIGKLVKLDQKGISNSWREWEKVGLVEKIGKKGQFKARYSLLELLLVYLPMQKQKSLKEKKNER